MTAEAKPQPIAQSPGNSDTTKEGGTPVPGV